MNEHLHSVLPDLRDGPCPTVLLRHDVPDGSWHVDWMLAREARATSRLITFRLDWTLDGLESGDMLDAEHIGDHRTAYLEYEGPVSGNRGRVRQVRRGHIFQAQPDRDGRSFNLGLLWKPRKDSTAGREALRQRLTLCYQQNSRWLVKILESRADIGNNEAVRE